MSIVDDVVIPESVLECGESAVEIYLTSIGSGNTEKFAEMCACRSAPGLKGTDSQNFRGCTNPFPNMPESLRQHYIKQCNEQGISFSGKVYKTGLVRQGYGGLRMDPQALVSDTHDVAATVRRNGWSSEGMVNERGPSLDDAEFPNEYNVSDDIVDEHTAHEVVENHGGRIKKKDYADLRQKVKAKLEGKV